MFFSLLLVTLFTALAVAFLAVRFFDAPIAAILKRIVTEELGTAWHRYIKFATVVVGVSRGVRIYDLERYVTPRLEGRPPLDLSSERWSLEVYRTVISTLQGIAWMLLVVFLVALLAFVIVRGFELRAARRSES